MRRVFVTLLLSGLLFSANANAWFFFWFPVGGSRPSSTSPLTSEPKEQPPKKINEPVVEPSIPTFQTPYKIEPQVNDRIISPRPSESRSQTQVQENNQAQSVGAKRLIEIKGLLDQGLINQKDYEVKKAEILKGM